MMRLEARLVEQEFDRDRLALRVNALALLAWSALAFYALLSNLQPGFWAVMALTIIGIYFLAAGLFFTPQPNPER